jgi:O-acetyl-ADP-ribose deacetylase (regulator of RNase III)
MTPSIMHQHLVYRDLLERLAVILLLFGGYTWAARRGVLQAKEALVVGAAMTFFAVSFIFSIILQDNRLAYGARNIRTLLEISILMTLPLLLALAYGVFALTRSLMEKTLAAAQIGGLSLRLVQGNIAALQADPPLDALVSPTDTNLRMSAGIAAALRSFGGMQIEREARAKAPIALGQAVVTGAGRLPAKSVVHAAVAARGVKTDAEIVRTAVKSALKAARKAGARRIAIPGFDTGVGRLPARIAAPPVVQIAAAASKEFDEIVIVLFSARAALPYRAEFKTLTGADAKIARP